MKPPFTVILHHVKNVDIAHDSRAGYWQPPVDPKRLKLTDQPDLQTARAGFEAWRNRNGLGGGNMARDCGEVYDSTGVLVGQFSYNGRLWEPGEWPTKEITI
jgi:hypothetical protein